MLKVRIALHVNPFESYGASPATWDYTVLASTQHRWTRFTLALARQAATHLPILEGWKAELNRVTGYLSRWFTYQKTVLLIQILTEPWTGQLCWS